MSVAQHRSTFRKASSSFSGIVVGYVFSVNVRFEILFANWAPPARVLLENMSASAGICSVVPQGSLEELRCEGCVKLSSLLRSPVSCSGLMFKRCHSGHSETVWGNGSTWPMKLGSCGSGVSGLHFRFAHVHSKCWTHNQRSLRCSTLARLSLQQLLFLAAHIPSFTRIGCFGCCVAGTHTSVCTLTFKSKLLKTLSLKTLKP